MGDLDFQSILLWYGVLVISLVVHEASHALFAKLGGDQTAYLGGQLTLNPVPHMQREPFGTIILPLALLIMSNATWCMGYAHIPVDAVWARRNPKKAALMSAAGPLSNVLLVALAFFVLKLLVWNNYADPYSSASLQTWVTPIDKTDGTIYGLARLATVFAFLNTILAILNLIPWPPFDGAGVVGGLVPAANRFYDFIKANFMFMIIGILVIWRILPELFLPAKNAIQSWI